MTHLIPAGLRNGHRIYRTDNGYRVEWDDLAYGWTVIDTMTKERVLTPNLDSARRTIRALERDRLRELASRYISIDYETA